MQIDRRQRHEMVRAARGDGQITIRLPRATLEALDKLSARAGMHRVAVIRSLIDNAEDDRVKRVMREHGMSREEAERFAGWPA